VLKKLKMIGIPSSFHRQLYLWCLGLIGFSLPISIFSLSVFEITLAINWILEKKIISRWHIIKSNKSLWFVALFYLVYLLWLLFTDDFRNGFHDLKIKLPFLLLPIIIATSEPIEKKWFHRILYFFILGVSLSTIYSGYQIIKLNGDVISNIGEISPFISHIKLALMANTSLFILGYLTYCLQNQWIRIGNILLILWLMGFLFLLQSITGIAILLTLLIILLIIWVFKTNNLLLRWMMVVSILTGIFLIVSYFTKIYTHYFSPLPINPSKLDQYTHSGNKYWHNISCNFLEGGNYTYLYICDEELRREWNKRSSFNFDGNDRKGQKIKYIIYRYLTSRDLRKDSAGLSELSEVDIQYIENGIPNKIYLQKFGLKARIYQMFWELYHYKMGDNPTGYSVSQRIEFYKTAFKIIKQNFWFGVGTGDIEKEFQLQYKNDSSPLALNARGRVHNNFFSFFISFGIVGLILIILSLFIPPWMEKKYSNYLFYSFFIIAVLSMFGDNTLKTHTGISWFAFFYGLFLYYNVNEKDPC
jgi:hypothetical protein